MGGKTSLGPDCERPWLHTRNASGERSSGHRMACHDGDAERFTLKRRQRAGLGKSAGETNGFSKKIENHIHLVALFYMWYNFARVHQTLRVTPAMEAGISSHVWSIQEISGLAASSVRAAA